MTSTGSLLYICWLLILLGCFNYIRYIGLSGIGSILSATLSTSSTILSLFVGFEHVLIFVMECFFWDIMARRLRGRRIKPGEIEMTRSLASNQGIYNLGTAIGLFWSIYTNHIPTTMMLLSCVILYAIFGAITVKRSIMYFQGIPAIIALAITAFNA